MQECETCFIPKEGGNTPLSKGSVNLYSTNCPKCNVLEKKLALKGVDFMKIEEFDFEWLISKGFYTAPVLEVDGELMKFEDAVKWVNAR